MSNPRAIATVMDRPTLAGVAVTTGSGVTLNLAGAGVSYLAIGQILELYPPEFREHSPVARAFSTIRAVITAIPGSGQFTVTLNYDAFADPAQVEKGWIADGRSTAFGGSGYTIGQGGAYAPTTAGFQAAIDAASAANGITQVELLGGQGIIDLDNTDIVPKDNVTLILRKGSYLRSPQALTDGGAIFKKLGTVSTTRLLAADGNEGDIQLTLAAGSVAALALVEGEVFEVLNATETKLMINRVRSAPAGEVVQLQYPLTDTFTTAAGSKIRKWTAGTYLKNFTLICEDRNQLLGNAGSDMGINVQRYVGCEFKVTGSGFSGPLSVVTFADGVVTWAGHPFGTGAPVQFVNAGGALPAPFVATTVYYVRDVIGNTFRLSATLGGAAIVSAGTGTGTHTGYTTAGLVGGLYGFESKWYDGRDENSGDTGHAAMQWNSETECRYHFNSTIDAAGFGQEWNGCQGANVVKPFAMGCTQRGLKAHNLRYSEIEGPRSNGNRGVSGVGLMQSGSNTSELDVYNSETNDNDATGIQTSGEGLLGVRWHHPHSSRNNTLDMYSPSTDQLDVFFPRSATVSSNVTGPIASFEAKGIVRGLTYTRSTADATPAACGAYTIVAANRTLVATVRVIGNRSATANQSFGSWMGATFFGTGAVATQVGTTTVPTNNPNESVGGTDASIGASGGTAAVIVTGIAAQDWTWRTVADLEIV